MGKAGFPLIQLLGPITTITINPAIVKGEGDPYPLVVKGDKPNDDDFVRNQAIAISNSPLGPFKMQPNLVINQE
ncbi:hypothetical protein GCM10027284_14770 [Cyclobacterium sediminis]